MIHFICPTCDKRLAVADAKAGKIVVCPACQTRLIVPETVAAPPPPEAATAEPPLKRRHAEEDQAPAPSSRRRRREDDEEEQPRPRRSDDENDDDDIPDAEIDRPRRRKKRRRRKSRALFSIKWMPFAFTPYLFTMVSLLATSFVLVVLSMAVPQFGYLSFVLGVGMFLCGRIWFLSVAFSDDSVQGMLCLWCGPYNYVYLCMNFEDTKRPFFLEITGEFVAFFSLFRMMD